LLANQKLDAIGRLAGGIAHDFNNLRGVILGRLDFVKRADLSEADLDHVREAYDAASHGAALTRQLMAFGRRQQTTPTMFDLHDVLTSKHDMLRRVLGKNIELTLSLDAPKSTIFSDPLQIEQVLLNLVLNARHAMEKSGKLLVATTLSADDEVTLIVTDSGCGMTPDVLAHLYEPFFTTKSPDEGTGLGLATVYAIVKENGGRVVVKSEVGRGSTFEVSFPLAL
jgi:signal transduction histidine kinase